MSSIMGKRRVKRRGSGWLGRGCWLRWGVLGLLVGAGWVVGCRSASPSATRPVPGPSGVASWTPPMHRFPPAAAAVVPGTPTPRFGDEIVVAGQRFRTGTPVVLWTDPGGYDAYRVDKRFSDFDKRQAGDWGEKAGNPQRYNLRDHGLSPAEVESHRGGDWTLPEMQQVVDQFVIHYDVCGTSRYCFEVLHDHRHLSVHFMLDVDGTIYQTLDLKERAWHAGGANSRSVGIEIANIGAYSAAEDKPWDRWYTRDASGRATLTIPLEIDRRSVRTPDFTGHPRRDALVTGVINGRSLEQYDLTEPQYVALAHLSATLHRVLPKIELQAPRDASGRVIDHALDDEAQADYHGLIGHYHITRGKVDPGPAFDWDRVIDDARELLR